MISPEIKPLDEFGTWGIECDKLGFLHAQLEFSFIAENGDPLHLKVPKEELFVGKYGPDPKFCQTYINTFDGVSIIGGSLLKYYYTAWDMDEKNPRLGFALNVSDLFSRVTWKVSDKSRLEILNGLMLGFSLRKEIGDVSPVQYTCHILSCIPLLTP